MKWGLVTLDGPSKSPQRGDLIQAKALKPPLGVGGPSFLLCPKQKLKKSGRPESESPEDNSAPRLEMKNNIAKFALSGYKYIK